MEITCNHPKSKNGRPVVLDDKGKVIKSPSEALNSLVYHLGISRRELSLKCGYDGHRGVERYFYDGEIPLKVLWVLHGELEKKK